jgi:hypothetical protein
MKTFPEIALPAFPQLTLLLCSFALLLLPVDASAASCPPPPGGGNVCTANDFTVTIGDISDLDECTNGEILPVVEVRFGVESTASERYDIGFFIGNAGLPALGGVSCSYSSLTPLGPPFNLKGGSGGYRDLDGDACGDVQSSDQEVIHDFVLNDVLCRDTDGDGRVNINAVLTWSRNANTDVCSDPNDETSFFTDQSSNCQVVTPDPNLPITVEPPPTMNVSKVALPTAMPAPGGPVLFVVSVTNTSAETDPLTIESLVDDVYGDITQVQGRVLQTNCEAPRQIAPRETYLCEFVGQISGPLGYVETDTVSVNAVDDDGTQLTVTDDATVTLVEAPPSMEIVKVAAPAEVKEPGGEVTYMVQVYNTSTTESLNITSLEDDLYGDVFSLGTCVRPLRSVLLAPREYFVCTFEQQVEGQTGDVITDVVSAVADTGDGILVADDSADVEIIDVASSIEVQKVAAPPELPEPGGSFAFIVRIQNQSPVDNVRIDAIVDNVYGDVTAIPGNTCALPRILGPGESYQCAFPGEFTGVAGDTQVDQVLVSGVDDDGILVSDSSQAEVIITAAPSEIQVIKTAAPTEIPEAGAPVTFDVTVVNLSVSQSVTIDSLVDEPYGDVSALATEPCPLPRVLPPGEAFSCSFTQPLAGGAAGTEFFDTVTATGADANGDEVAASDTAIVTVNATPPVEPTIRVVKIVRPKTLEEPGGPVVYAVLTANLSQAETVRLETIEDDIYGDLSDPANPQIEIIRGCNTGDASANLEPGQVGLCLFRAEATGVSGDQVVDTATVTACVLADDACSPVVLEDSDMAAVSITRGPSTIEVFKDASPTSITEPGGPVTFAVEVVNTSVSAVITIDSLVDEPYGDITQVQPPLVQTTCAVPQVLPAGTTYDCSFTVEVEGSNGDRLTDLVTAAGTDDRDPPVTVTGQDDAGVVILGSPPSLGVTKTPSPTVVQVPGDVVSFAVAVENTSAAATLEITTLEDNVYGNLDGLGDCSVPQTLAPGEIYRCSFPGDVFSNQPGQHDNTVSVSASTSDDRFVTEQASAIVRIQALADAIGVPAGSLWALLVATLAVLLSAVIHFRRRAEPNHRK